MGVAVAVIEETFFRGALQGALQRRLEPSHRGRAGQRGVFGGTFPQTEWREHPVGPGHMDQWREVSRLDRDAVVGPEGRFRRVRIAVPGGLRFWGLAYARTKAFIFFHRAARGLGAGQRIYPLVGVTIDVTRDVASWPMLVVLLVLVVWLCRTTFKPLRGPASPVLGASRTRPWSGGGIGGNGTWLWLRMRVWQSGVSALRALARSGWIRNASSYCSIASRTSPVFSNARSPGCTAQRHNQD